MTVPEVVDKLGKRIHELRVEHELTQEALAERIGVTRNFISFLERGEKGATLETLVSIAHAFDMTLSELFLGVDGTAPRELKRLSASVAGQPLEVQRSIFRVLEELLTIRMTKP